MTAAHILTYGIENDADVMAKQIEISAQGTSFELVTPKGTKQITVSLVYRFNVYNVLAAAATAIAAGLPFDTIASALEELQGVRYRFELVNHNQPFPVVVDYAHTPDSLENVLNTCKDMTEGKLFVVVGCGGDRDKTKRPKIEIAVRIADEPILLQITREARTRYIKRYGKRGRRHLLSQYRKPRAGYLLPLPTRKGRCGSDCRERA